MLVILAINTTSDTSNGGFIKIKFIKHIFYLKVAFTLAEILITIGIVGVIAAIVLPNVYSKFEEKVLVVRAKKPTQISLTQ